MPDTMNMIEPRVTTRAMLDPTRRCALACKFCYHLHTDLESVKPWEEQRQEVLAAVARGCDCADLTGGDPLDNPHVIELIKLCVEQGLSLRVISSLNCSAQRLEDAMNAGVDDWLISLHGAKEETHNSIVHNHSKGPVGKTKYRTMQIKRLHQIMSRMQWGANYVVVHPNQAEMADFARWLLTLPRPPHIVNFLNWNPHYNWNQGKFREEALALIPDPAISGPVLDEAIDVLEDAGIGVNCRYTPMCVLAERHRKNVCSDLHVAFDGGEWLNGISGGTIASAEAYGRRLSQSNELQTEPCASCGLKPMCGGANRIWHQLATEKFGCEVLSPQPTPGFVSEPAYWHYRRENALGNDPRR